MPWPRSGATGQPIRRRLRWGLPPRAPEGPQDPDPHTRRERFRRTLGRHTETRTVYRTSIWNRRQFERLVVDYIDHYNRHRPHRSSRKNSAPTRLRRRLTTTFESELSLLDETTRSEIIELFDLHTSWDTWERLGRWQRLLVTRSKHLVATLVSNALAPW